MRSIASIVLMATSTIALCQSPNTELSRLLRAKSIRCVFTNGSTAKWENGVPEIEKSTFGTDLVFDAINPRKGIARLIGNQGVAQVKVSRSMGGLTFVEQTGSGSTITTTVFPTYAKGTNQFIVVHSRHILPLLGDPISSQYHGTCIVLD